jgi:hypothetical protein
MEERMQIQKNFEGIDNLLKGLKYFFGAVAKSDDELSFGIEKSNQTLLIKLRKLFPGGSSKPVQPYYFLPNIM